MPRPGGSGGASKRPCRPRRANCVRALHKALQSRDKHPVGLGYTPRHRTAASPESGPGTKKKPRSSAVRRLANMACSGPGGEGGIRTHPRCFCFQAISHTHQLFGAPLGQGTIVSAEATHKSCLLMRRSEAPILPFPDRTITWSGQIRAWPDADSQSLAERLDFNRHLRDRLVTGLDFRLHCSSIGCCTNERC